MRFDECSDKIVEIVKDILSECSDDFTDDEIDKILNQKLENETCFEGLNKEEMAISLVMAAFKLFSANTSENA